MYSCRREAIRFVLVVAYVTLFSKIFNICWHIPRLQIFEVLNNNTTWFWDALQAVDKEQKNIIMSSMLMLWLFGYFWSCWPSVSISLCDNTLLNVIHLLNLFFPFALHPGPPLHSTHCLNLDSYRKKSSKMDGKRDVEFLQSSLSSTTQNLIWKSTLIW